MRSSAQRAAARVDFYFDFISPYAYFASLKIEALAAKHGRCVEWHPMLLGVSVVKVMGLKPLMQTPLKSDYLRTDVQRQARRMGLVLGRPMPGPSASPVVAGRAMCWIKLTHPERQGQLCHSIFDAWWRKGLPLTTVDELLANVTLPVEGTQIDEMRHALREPLVAALLRESVDESLAAGVFGAPTFIVDGEMFWGFDRMDHLDEWLARGGW